MKNVNNFLFFLSFLEPKDTKVVMSTKEYWPWPFKAFGIGNESPLAVSELKKQWWNFGYRWSSTLLKWPNWSSSSPSITRSSNLGPQKVVGSRNNATGRLVEKNGLWKYYCQRMWLNGGQFELRVPEERLPTRSEHGGVARIVVV